MVTFIVVLFFALLVLFLVVGLCAPMSRKFLHDEDGVLDAVVVANIDSASVVRLNDGKLYAIPKVLPIDSEIAVQIKHDSGEDDAQETVAFRSYFATETNSFRAIVIRRLNEDFLLCRYGTKQMLVMCTPDEQQRMQKFVKKITFKQGKDVRTELGDRIMVIPFCRMCDDLLLAVCYEA